MINTLKPKSKVVREYNHALALPVLLNSENWTVRSKYKSRLTAAEMKFMRKTAKYTWRDHKASEEMLNKLKISSILEKISYKSDWIQNVN
jgi:hypothetical protein